MKSLMSLWMVLASEIANRYGYSTIRDFKTITERVEHEGLSFLTITLADFAKDFERSLEQGFVAPDAFPAFKKTGSARLIPAFLSGITELVFDPCSGLLLDSDTRTADLVQDIRQLTRMFAKIEEPCSDERISSAYRNWIECELDVRESDYSFPPLKAEFSRMSFLLFREVFAQADQQVYNLELTPRHGPGSTADGLLGNKKYHQTEWTERLEKVFPFGEYALPSWRYYNRIDHVTFHEPGDERPTRLTHVPKTLKTPRIIAIEPTAMQYAQQALASSLVKLLESDSLVGGKDNMIGFLDQEPNQVLAKKGSDPLLGNPYATLDLSEASDRVSSLHVKALFGDRFPSLEEMVFACRSTHAEVPGKGIVPLAKYASMGSALCFPCEAMVFLTIVFLGIEKELNRALTRSDVLRLKGHVRVYGDDIVVPVQYADSVIGTLEAFGLKVNARKSFSKGNFRESCGGDYYRGLDVSNVRLTQLLPTSRTDVPRVLAAVSLRNQFYNAGLWQTAAWLDGLVGGILYHWPPILPGSPVLGRETVLPGYYPRWSKRYHSPLVKGWVPYSKLPANAVSDEFALLKCFLNTSGQPLAEGHLERSGRPAAVNLKLRWVQPF